LHCLRPGVKSHLDLRARRPPDPSAIVGRARAAFRPPSFAYATLRRERRALLLRPPRCKTKSGKPEQHHRPGRRLGNGGGDRGRLEEIGEGIRSARAAEIGAVALDMEYVLQGD